MAHIQWSSRLVSFTGLLAVAACAPEPGFTVGDPEFAAPPGSLAPSLALAGDIPVLTWLEPTDADRHALRVAVRGDDGWQVVGTPVENDSLFVNWADFPSLTVLPDGRWLVHWLQKTAPATYAYHVKLALSEDRGVTWSEPFVPHGDRSPTEHGFVSTVPLGQGAALVWLDGRNTGGGTDASGHPAGAMTVRATVLGADGMPAPDTEIDARVCECCQTGLALATSGLVAVYRDRSEGEIRDIAVSRYVENAWTSPVHVSQDGWHYPGCPVNGPAIAAAGDVVVVAWFTAPDQVARAYAAISHDGGATFGERITIDEGRPAGRLDALFLDDETAVITWIEEQADSAAIRARTLGVDGRPGPAFTVATTTAARAAGFPQLLRAGDELIAAWTDPVARRVRAVTIQIGD